MQVFSFSSLTATILALGSAAFADVIVLGADPWCPYNCDPDSENPGYMVEIAREALAPFGHEVEYVTVSWARGIRQAELGQINGVIGAVPEEVPEFIFGPSIGTSQDSMVFRSGEAIPLEQFSEMEGLRIGAINGYEYYGPVNDYIQANSNDRDLVQYTSGDDALEQNLRKLAAGRLDIVAEVRAVIDYSIQTIGLEGQFEVVVAEDPDEIFIAFSPALETSQTYADQLSEGVQLLRDTNRYDAILAKYGLTLDTLDNQ